MVKGPGHPLLLTLVCLDLSRRESGFCHSPGLQPLLFASCLLETHIPSLSQVLPLGLQSLSLKVQFLKLLMANSSLSIPHQSWIYLLKGFRKIRGVELPGPGYCPSLLSLFHLHAHCCELLVPHSYLLNLNHLLWLSSSVTSFRNVFFRLLYGSSFLFLKPYSGVSHLAPYVCHTLSYVTGVWELPFLPTLQTLQDIPVCVPRSVQCQVL